MEVDARNITLKTKSEVEMKKLIKTSASVSIIILVLIFIDMKLIDQKTSGILGSISVLPLSCLFCSVSFMLYSIFMWGISPNHQCMLALLMPIGGYFIFLSIAGWYLLANPVTISVYLILGLFIALIYSHILEIKIKKEKVADGKTYLFSSISVGLSMLVFLIFFFLLK